MVTDIPIRKLFKGNSVQEIFRDRMSDRNALPFHKSSHIKNVNAVRMKKRCVVHWRHMRKPCNKLITKKKNRSRSSLSKIFFVTTILLLVR